MRVTVRPLCTAIATLLLIASGTVPLSAETSTDARPPCTHALIAVDETIDSSHSHSGDVFHYVTVENVTAPDGTPVPSGTMGYGVVANAAHAERGGRGGYLALETRFVVLPSGKHVQIIIDRVNDEMSSAVGSSANAPGVLGLLPIVGYAVGGYDSLHHGKDATIPRGTRIGVFLGDDAALGMCRSLKAGESPPPAAPPASPMPATAAAVPAPIASERPR
jgi:hypothetical protein